MHFHEIRSSARRQITALRLRCRAPSTRTRGRRVVQRWAPRRSRSRPPAPSPPRAALHLREQRLRSRLRRRGVALGATAPRRLAKSAPNGRFSGEVNDTGFIAEPRSPQRNTLEQSAASASIRVARTSIQPLIGQRHDGRQGQLRRHRCGSTGGGHRTAAESTSPGGVGCV